MKPFRPNKQQLEAINDSATMLIVPIDGKCLYIKDTEALEDFIYHHSPLQPNKEYFVQEEFEVGDCDEIYYCIDGIKRSLDKINASEMQEHQSRFKFKCISVEVKRVQELNYEEKMNLCQKFTSIKNAFWRTKYFKDWYNKQYGNHEDNPYVFLCKIERK